MRAERQFLSFSRRSIVRFKGPPMESYKYSLRELIIQISVDGQELKEGVEKKTKKTKTNDQRPLKEGR